MSKQEIEQILEITNIETIEKKDLKPEDDLYTEDTLIIINHTTSDEVKTVQETSDQNWVHSTLYVFLAGICGIGLTNIRRIFITTTWKDRLKAIEPSLRPLRKDELETMMQILLLKKQNLELLEDNENKAIQYRRLRKD